MLSLPLNALKLWDSEDNEQCVESVCLCLELYGGEYDTAQGDCTLPSLGRCGHEPLNSAAA